MDLKNISKSKNFKTAIIFFGALIILLVTFKIGEFVGFRKANFSYQWGENYHRNFGGPRGGFFPGAGRDLSDKDYMNANGTYGSILKIDGSTILVSGADNAEKSIVVSNKTIIRNGRENIKITDLKVDDKITIVGSPNDQGQIEAKLIRVIR